jgi:hypothetical protein
VGGSRGEEAQAGSRVNGFCINLALRPCQALGPPAFLKRRRNALPGSANGSAAARP